jgi:long-chain acyl-CoA synthetase
MHQTEPTIEEITALLPRRLHEVAERYVVDAPDRVAMIEDGAKWTYRDLDRYVRQTAERLTAFGVRAGDRIMLVSENCIALAALLLAASRIDAWAIVSNPRLSARELDQIRDHSGARRMFFTCAVSKDFVVRAAQRYRCQSVE